MIDSVVNGREATGDAPLITFALFAYNQEQTIQEALDGAFAQTYSPLEIILSDDCSKDRTFDIMTAQAEAYTGPHRVILNRNPQNLNIGAHINKVAHLAGGALVVLAAGDDVSLPTRTEKIVSRWLKRGRRPDAIYSDFEAMDAASRPVPAPAVKLDRRPHSKESVARGDAHVLGATTAFSKDVWSKFSPMSPAVHHEDRVLPFRALLLGGSVELIDEKLVRYRVEGGVSTRSPLTAQQYLYDYLPTLTARILPDAFQRLNDLEMIAPDNRRLRQICHTAIAEQEAVIAISRARGPHVESICLQAIRKGARWIPILRLYLRFRFFPVFRIYYRVRNVQ